MLVLQAQGVRIDLTGTFYVNEHNITSATFRSLPDVPIRRLDLVLPEGKGSVLVASSSLCKKALHMSTAINAQDGARLKPTIPDVPIRRLDLLLPEGKSSILAASAGLCTKKP